MKRVSQEILFSYLFFRNLTLSRFKESLMMILFCINHQTLRCVIFNRGGCLRLSWNKDIIHFKYVSWFNKQKHREKMDKQDENSKFKTSSAGNHTWKICLRDFLKLTNNQRAVHLFFGQREKSLIFLGGKKKKLLLIQQIRRELRKT